MACYETTDKGQFYDLLTLLLQHGKDYIMKIVKVEVRNYVATYLPAVVSVVTFIIYYINNRSHLWCSNLCSRYLYG